MPATSLILILLGVGYLLGSFPTAFFVVRAQAGLDLRQEGSSNIGAMNSFEVTGAKWIGIAVTLGDALKGILAVLAGWQIAASWGTEATTDWIATIALLGAVAGHNYNLWLSISAKKLSGGKGLATAAGGLLLFMPWIIAVWAVLFFLGRKMWQWWQGAPEIIPGNLFAISFLPLAGWGLYDMTGLAFTLIAAALMWPKHITQIRDLWPS